jgi:uncharacterized damage-inducible protein DinB
MPSLSAEEVLHWNDTAARNWQRLLERHPEALGLPCDVRDGSTVADLLQHIVAVELRYAQRLADQPISDYADIPKSTVADLFATHDRAIATLRNLIADSAFDWELELELVTRSIGTLIATRRTVLFHALLHGTRHYAQLAMLLRHSGIAADFEMDYLMMGARRA